MKEYDRETNTWLDPIEASNKRAKRKLCKGNREHDWLLCLPSYTHTDGSVLGLDKVEEYYKIEDEREDAQIVFDERLEAIGVKSRLWRRGSFLGRRRSYICGVCLKQK